MKTTQITKLKKDYDAKGTIMIPFKKYPNPFSKDDFNKLKMYCENVDKEFISIGDAGEKNHLLVGRFMTDKEKPEIVKNSEVVKQETTSTETTTTTNEEKSNNPDTTEHNIKLTIQTEKDESIEKFKPLTDTSSIETNEEEVNTSPKEEIIPGKLSFNDMDSVLDMGTNKSSEINAPKNVERLEKISAEQNQKRKDEEAEYDDDDEERIKIFDDAKLNLDNLDVHDLNKKLDLTPDPILDDVEVLA